MAIGAVIRRVCITSVILGLVLGCFVWISWPDLKGRYYIYQMTRLAHCPPAGAAWGQESYYLNTFADGIPSSKIEVFYYISLTDISEACGSEPTIYRARDIIDFPRIRAVWQREGYYLNLLVAMGNDSDSIRWFAKPGVYDPQAEHAKLAGEDYKLPIRRGTQ